MTGEEARWAGLGPEDCEPATQREEASRDTQPETKDDGECPLCWLPRGHKGDCQYPAPDGRAQKAFMEGNVLYRLSAPGPSLPTEPQEVPTPVETCPRCGSNHRDVYGRVTVDAEFNDRWKYCDDPWHNAKPAVPQAVDREREIPTEQAIYEAIAAKCPEDRTPLEALAKKYVDRALDALAALPTEAPRVEDAMQEEMPYKGSPLEQFDKLRAYVRELEAALEHIERYVPNGIAIVASARAATPRHRDPEDK